MTAPGIDGWISANSWCEKYHEQKDTIHARVAANRWQRGVHYSAPDGGTFFVHEARAKQWLIDHGRWRP